MCSSAGCTYKNAAKHPMNYFVPNFGVDIDIGESHASLEQAEGELNHTWIPVLKEDIPKGHPVDYFVPNFGLDHEILAAEANIAAEEKKHGAWTPVQDDNGVWEVPEAANNDSYIYGKYASNDFVQTDVSENLKSDPICSSAGCNYASGKGKATHPMNYFVPNLGRDKGINSTWASLDWAENSLNHHWNPELKKVKGPAKNYFVPDFGLEEDVVDTLANIKNEEKRLKHKWVPVQDENGVWIVPEAYNNKSYTYAAQQPSLVQLDADVDSDPICSSAGCTGPR
jgi:hypothetical protein